jgi:hypothetical protein
MEKLTSAKEELTGQLREKDIELDKAKGETTRLANALDRYRSQHIRSAEMLRDGALARTSGTVQPRNATYFCDNPIQDNSVLSPKPLHLFIKQ